MTFWLYTGWGCGGIEVENGIVIGGAPIFRKLIGAPLARLKRIYDVRTLSTANQDYNRERRGGADGSS